MIPRPAPILLAALLALWAPAAGGAEPPPAQGTRLHFEKTLFVQRTATGRVFAETRKVRPGESLSQILRREYRVSDEALPGLLAAFRALNPGVDPDRLAPGQVVRVPFKMEERLGDEDVTRGGETYTVRAGDSLWRILRNRYGVPRAQMGAALAAVARANPDLKDPNRLLVGQRLRIPDRVLGIRRAAAARPTLPDSFRTVLELLGSLGCEVTTAGETFLPLGRGRTLRLAARDFPLVTGPTGRRVLLDPARRISSALVRAVEAAWGYRVVQGVEPSPEAQLARVLPFLGLYEVSPGAHTVDLGGGAELVILSRWTVVPRARDLWEGQVHLLLPAGSVVDPVLNGELRRLGMALHVLGPAGTAPGTGAAGPPLRPARLDMTDRAAGAGRLLALLGVPHRVRPLVDCRLAGGVRYRVRPEITFRHLGLSYAVPPAVPSRAGAILERAGYFTLEWPPDAAPTGLLGDILALLGVPHTRTTVEAPPGQAVRVRATGIVLDDEGLAALLYPDRVAEGAPRVFLTEAPLTPALARPLADQGLLPWIVGTSGRRGVGTLGR